MLIARAALLIGKTKRFIDLSFSKRKCIYMFKRHSGKLRRRFEMREMIDMTDIRVSLRRAVGAAAAAAAAIASSGLHAGAEAQSLDRVRALLGDGPRAQGTNFAHRPGTPLLRDGEHLTVETRGAGPEQAVVFMDMEYTIDAYRELIDRIGDRYRFHFILPPGFSGAPAYPWPALPEDVEKQNWTQRFLDDAHEIVESRISGSATIIGAGVVALPLSIQYAAKYPERISGFFAAGATARRGASPIPRWYPADADDIAARAFDLDLQKRYVIGAFFTLWRSVDGPTWRANSYPPATISRNETRGREILAAARLGAPFNIGMNYFAETLTTDLTDDVAALNMPVRVLLNIASEKSRIESGASPAEARAQIAALKADHIRDWGAARPNVTIDYAEDSGIALWIDAPEAFDAGLASLAQRN
ncbi:MAG: hypothetical protein Tsb0010_04080 [Parvularculaceae bacterium]